MSKIQLQEIGFDTYEYTDEERETLDELVSENYEVLKRKSNSLADNIMIAGMLVKAEERHDKNSLIYRSILDWVKEVDPAWTSKDYRLQMRRAYSGYLKLAGSEEEKAKLLPKLKSVSALAEIRLIDDADAYDFTKMVLKYKEPLTQSDVKTWTNPKKQNQWNKYNNSSANYSAPKLQPAKPVEQVPASDQTITLPSTSVTADTAEPNEVEDYQKLDPTSRNLMRLVQALEELDTEEVYGRPELIEQLKPHQFKLESLVSSISNRPSMRH